MGISDLYKILIPREVEREVDNSIELQLEAQNSQELNDMYTALMAGAGEFGTGEYTGPTKKELGLTPPVESSDKVAETLLKEQIKNAIPVNLITQEELDKQTSMINRGETEPVVTEQSSPVKSSDKVAATSDVKEDVKEYNLSGPDYQADVATFREKADKEKIISTPTDTSRYTFTPSQLYEGIKNNDEGIINYVYNAISKHEWAGREPIFDFVRVKKNSKSRSSAFGPAQIVGDTVRNELKRIAEKYGKDSEEYIFADKLQAAQNLFLNLADKYRKGKNINKQTAEEVANTDAAIDEDYKYGGAAFKKLGIDKDKFVDYVKEGYFLPSNFKNSKGIPVELLGDNYKENYMKLFKSVLLNKASGDKSLEETLQKYHGHPTDKNQNKTYQEEVFKNLFDTTNPYDKPIEDNETEIEVRPSYQPITKKKQSGGMIESDPYKKQPRFI